MYYKVKLPNFNGGLSMKKKILSVVAVIALAAILAVALVACIPSDPDKAAANLKEEGYVSIPLGASLGNVDDMVFATKGDEGIIILYFKESADAKEFYESDEAKSLKEEFFDENESLVFKRQGKIVYIGTEAAVKAAR